MATRNFNFMKSPRHGLRGGRFVLGGSDQLTSGVPVIATGIDELKRTIVELAPEGTAKPKTGRGGVLVFENIDTYEYAPVGYTNSDIDLVKPGQAVQVVTGNGGEVKARLVNTIAGENSFGRAGYPKQRTMIAGVSIATPSVAVGDYLVPGVGTDAGGYWKETATAADAWLVVTGVDGNAVEVEFLL